MESGEVLADARVTGFDSGGVLFGRAMLAFLQDLSIDRIVVGVKDRVLIPRHMLHQLAQRFGRAITNTRGDFSSGIAINSQPQESLVVLFFT